MNVSMRRGLNGLDKGVPGLLALETPEFLGGDDDNLIAPVNGNVLRAFTANAANQLTEASLGVLQEPVSG